MKKIITALSVLFLVFASCASMYVQPTIKTQIYRQTLPGNSALLFKLIQNLLPAAGYSIASVDSSTGMISTVPAEVTLDPDACDCGTAMGLPVVKSEGIKAKVSFEVGVQGNEMIVNASITPIFSNALSALYAGMSIQCVSKGKVEELLAKNVLKSVKIPKKSIFLARGGTCTTGKKN